jgi:DNA-binding NarL/FixJ family response regulator
MHMIHLQSEPDSKSWQNNWLHVCAQFQIHRCVVHTMFDLLTEIHGDPTYSHIWIDWELLHSATPLADLKTIADSVHRLITHARPEPIQFVMVVPHTISSDWLQQLVNSNLCSVVIRSDFKIKHVAESCIMDLMRNKTHVTPSVMYMLSDQSALFARTSERKMRVSWLVPSCADHVTDHVQHVINSHMRAHVDTFRAWPTLLRSMVMPTFTQDVLILDMQVLTDCAQVTMLDRVQCLHTIRLIAQNPDLKLCVAVNSQVHPDLVRSLIKMKGVHGILPIPSQGFTYDHLIKGLQEVLQGVWHVPESIHKNMYKTTSLHTTTTTKLTGRQKEILNLVVKQGASNKVIANRLKITEGAVKHHVGKLLKKYGLRNRTELAALSPVT